MTLDDRSWRAIIAAVDGSVGSEGHRVGRPGFSRAELDSHANMVCLGKHCTVIRRTGQNVRVNAFASAVGSLKQVPLVDAAIVYEDNNSQQYLLVFYNALYIPSMENHLIPPFILREAGLRVDETPKIQSTDPGEKTHTIYDPGTGLRIHLGLHGIFSYFSCRAMTNDEMRRWSEYPIIHATPKGVWDPYNSVFASEEAGFVDSFGNYVHDMVPEKRSYLIDVNEDDSLTGLSALTAAYAAPMCAEEYQEQVSRQFALASIMLMDGEGDIEGPLGYRQQLSVVDDDIQRGIANIDSVLVEEELASALDELQLSTAYGIAAGSVSAFEMEDDDLFVEGIGAIIGAATATFSAVASGKAKGVSPEQLSKLWRISHADAERTLKETTQLGRYSADTTISREFPTNDRALRYRRLIDSVFFTDTMFVTGKAKSTRGYTCAQVFVSDKGFVWVHLMKSVSDYLTALKGFCKEVGVPESLVCDPHKSQTADAVRQWLYEVGTTLRVLERGTQWANLAERFIGLLKNGTRNDLRESNAPMVFWDYAMERRVQIMNLTARDTHKLRGLNPYTVTMGDQGDISNLCSFGWFEWCYYLEDRKASRFGFPHAIERLGRCLGPSKNVGNEMAQWVLTQAGQVVARRTLRRLTPHELSVTNETERAKRQAFMEDIRRKFGDAVTLPPKGEIILPTIKEESDEALYQMWLGDSSDSSGWVDEGDVDFETLVDDTKAGWIPEADIVDAAGKPIANTSFGDLMIGIEVQLPQGEEKTALCKVLRRSVDKDGKTTGVYNKDPTLNTMLYDVEFPDGIVKQYGANIIAQNVLEQVEDDGYFTVKLKQILDHRREGNAVSKEQRYVETRNGQKKLRQSTVGWKFLVEYTDGKKQWIMLKDLKESNPVDVAEYVTARNLDDEVAFAWWVPYTLRKKATIIASVKARARRKTHKYGIEIPTSVEDAMRIDKENGNTLWMEALALEVGELWVALQLVPDGEPLPPGYIKATGHIIFDVKMDFRRKARWVKDGHKTPEPETSNYAGVVSRESVRIAFTYAALMGVPVMAADIRNAYLQAPSSEKHYIVCGPEFGLENAGKRALIKRAIYGGRVAGRDFWLHLRKCMEELGFESSKADPDVWFRPAKKRDGTEYMEYVLLYVDDVLVVSENAESIIRNEIGRHWAIKESSIEKPSLYLGGRCREVELTDGTKCWAFGSSQYVQAAVKNVEEWLAKSDRKLPKKAEAPFKTGYRPEIDVSRELVGDEASYYQSLIGILRWIVELGRVDICLEVSLMSSHLALPREGHLEALFHIFAYLRKYHNAEMLFDPSLPHVDPSAFQRQDWTFSAMTEEDMKEVLPPYMPASRGRGFVIRVFVDADHAGDEITRRSRTGFIVYINNAPVYWYSKRQGSVESSTYQAEFTAMKEAAEYVRALRYKLRMMGIPVEGAAFIFGDNKSVLANTMNPGSTLKKKCAAVAYHLVREGVARGEWITAWISTHENIADLLTKPMSAGAKRNGFVKKILQHIFRKNDDD